MRRSHDPDLARAVSIWNAGNFIPADLWAVLSARGYNMGRLEAIHLN